MSVEFIGFCCTCTGTVAWKNLSATVEPVCFEIIFELPLGSLPTPEGCCNGVLFNVEFCVVSFAVGLWPTNPAGGNVFSSLPPAQLLDAYSCVGSAPYAVSIVK